MRRCPGSPTTRSSSPLATSTRSAPTSHRSELIPEARVLLRDAARRGAAARGGARASPRAPPDAARSRRAASRVHALADDDRRVAPAERDSGAVRDHGRLPAPPGDDAGRRRAAHPRRARERRVRPRVRGGGGRYPLAAGARRSGTPSNGSPRGSSPAHVSRRSRVPGFTDSHYLRQAFGTVAYGFFPIRLMDTEQATKLVHSANERIPVDDLELGVDMLRVGRTATARVMSETADALVVFGITGDLARTKTVPALYDLTEQRILTCPVIGVGRRPLRNDEVHDHARSAIEAAKGATSIDTCSTRFSRDSRTSAATRVDDELYEHLGVALEGSKLPVFYLAIPPATLPRERRAPGSRGSPGRRPSRRREAVRNRPRLRARAEPPPDRARARGAAVPHRPLPRQGARAGHHVPALLERALRAGLEPGARRLDPGDDGGGLRRRGPRRVLRRRRRPARRRAEPSAAGARARDDGAAGRRRRRGLPSPAGRLSLDAVRRSDAHRARPVPGIRADRGRAVRLRHGDVRRPPTR